MRGRAAFPAVNSTVTPTTVSGGSTREHRGGVLSRTHREGVETAEEARDLPQIKDDLRGWRLGRVVTVVDRGFSSKDNLDYLRRAGGHWIAGERMRDGAADHEAALSRQGRYQQVRDNLRVKEVRLGSWARCWAHQWNHSRSWVAYTCRVPGEE